MKVQKRDGKLVEFDKTPIINAIESCMRESKAGINEVLSREVAASIEKTCSDKKIVTIEEIQEMVEDLLIQNPEKEYAKVYIRYRSNKAALRGKKESDYNLLTDSFISKYKHLPNPMGQLGQFVYYRTYSRYLPEKRRREYWWETVRRAVEYNCSLVPTTSRDEAEELYDNIYHMRQFLSGRTFWVGNTQVARDYPMSNYNCAFTVIDKFEAYQDLFYLLMLGSGVGLRILKEDVEKLPKVRKDIDVIHGIYSPKPKGQRQDNTAVNFHSNDLIQIVIGDSKEGWMQALRYFFDVLTRSEYKNINTILMDYDHVRPKGERLKKFGGTASGHESLKTMFSKMDSIIKKAGAAHDSNRFNLRPFDCLEIANVIGENVVSGGVRRSSEIALIDADDTECIEAKSGIYKQVDGEWVVNKELAHRQMSNNSILYNSKPTREQLKWQIEKMRYSGEPGWVNGEAGSKRRPNMKGVNPCGEILLDDQGMCNLTTLNAFAFIDKAGKLDREGILKAQKHSVRAGYRMTCVEMELYEWNYKLQRDKLVGASLTGWQDMVNALGMTKKEEIELLRELRDVASEEVKKYAKQLNQNEPLLVTTVKPEGTLSQLPTVSSGVHYSHSPYYIRRVRISSNDPLVKVCEELEYPVFPEVGQVWENCKTKVVEFPVKAPEGRTKFDVSAIEQLENYKMFMENYVDHNCSITVHVRDHEWEDVEQWVWDNWDIQIGLTFLSLEDSFYQLLPYEKISEEEYNERISKMKSFIPSLISKYETEEENLDVGDAECATGFCPVR